MNSLHLLIKHLQGQHDQKRHGGKGGSAKALTSNEMKSKLAKAAQGVIDEWEQDEEGFDPDFGGGGVCDGVCQAMIGVVSDELPDLEIYEGGQPGDDHAWMIAHDPDSGRSFGVDIPPQVYETGGGYSWRKIEGAKVRPHDVDVWEMDFDPELA